MKILQQLKPYLLVLSLAFLCCFQALAQKPRVLVFSKTAAFKHASIPSGILAIQALGRTHHFAVDTTTDVTNFNEHFLAQYKAVIFLSPTGSVFNEEQKEAFQAYIQQGNGFVGIHAATDFEYDWAWYGDLVGAYFASHPKQQEAHIQVIDNKHISTKHLPSTWVRKDEWYNFRKVSPAIHVLLNLDESTYEVTKDKMGEQHPIAWYHEFDGGRAFYTGLGHTDEAYQEPLFLQHLLGGICYAANIPLK